jgi:hypothetical protein
MFQQIRIVAYPGVIKCLLHDTIGRGEFDKGRASGLIVRIKLRNVGVVALAFLVPGAVDQNDDALHATLTKRRQIRTRLN